MRACLATQVLDARALPSLAEDLLSHGYETPKLVALAALGTEQFDPRDARETGKEAVVELGADAMSASQAGDVAAAFLALQVTHGRITARQLTRMAVHLFVNSDSKARGELYDLYAADDLWDAAWFGTNDEAEASVQNTVRRLLSAFPK